MYHISFSDEGKYVGVVDPDTNEMTLIPLKQVKLRPAVSIAGEVVEEAPEPKKSRQELVSLVFLTKFLTKITSSAVNF